MQYEFDKKVSVMFTDFKDFTHTTYLVNAASDIRNFMLARKKEKEAKEEIAFEFRIGIHTGAVVAGIVGVKKYAYDIWGDTVDHTYTKPTFHQL